MGMNTILTLIVGIVMTTMVGTQVAPSIIEQIKTKKVQTQTINNQEVIFEAIKRYTTLKQEAPEDLIEDLIKPGYIDAKVNDNGFGGTYEISVNKALGVATITTTIADPKVQEAFLNSFMGTSKPTRVGTTNNFKTTFVLPNEVMHGNALLMTGIPIQATPPDSNINKYWYDTSGSKVVLKIYDGASWKEINLGGGAGVSIGSIETFAGVAAKIPEGYLLCNGQEVSRTTYKDLFDVIGTTYGSTSGTTFKVPNLQGKFIRGHGSTMLSHDPHGYFTSHTSDILGATQGDTIRNITGNVGNIQFHDWIMTSGSFYIDFSSHSTTLNNDNSGHININEIYFDASREVPTANENRPINMAMNYIIKH